MCRRCGWVYFKNPASASAVAIISSGEVVLVKRKVPPYPGKWCLPAGFQEYHESPEETAVREAKEETNLEIRLLGLHRVFFSNAHPGKNTVVHVYLAEPVSGTMKAGDDASDVKVFSLDRLPSGIAFRSHIETLRQIRDYPPRLHSRRQRPAGRRQTQRRRG